MPDRVVRMTSHDYQNYVGKRLYEFQQEDIMSDMMLRASDGGIIPVHKCVAAATSLLVINAIKVHDQSNKAQLVLEMETVNTEILQKTVEFMYLGQVDIEDSKLALLREAAELLQMDNLTEACDCAMEKKPIEITQASSMNQQESTNTHGSSEGDVMEMSEDYGETGADQHSSAASSSSNQPRVETNHLGQSSPIKTQAIKVEDPGCEASALSQDNLGKIEAQLLGKASTDMEGREEPQSETTCPLCSVAFHRQGSLLQHVKEMHAEQVQQWNEGGSGDATESLNKNILKLLSTVSAQGKRKELTYSCSHCEDTFPSHQQCVEHEKQHVGLKFPCTYCNKVFRADSNRIRHEKTHEQERPYGCPFCPQAFSQKSMLEEHVGVHTGLPVYQCEYCEMRFNTKPGLDTHMAHHFEDASMDEEDDNSGYECQQCDSVFPTTTERNIHEEWHKNEGHSASCPCCTQKTSSHTDPSRTRQRTLPMKFVGGRFGCSFCSKTFTSKQGMMTHERVHTGEKPYACRYCMQRFTQRHHVTQHERVHTGEKPYQCRFCAKFFSLKANRDVHERIHTGLDKPFRCSYCQKTFSRKNKCAEHELACTERTTTLAPLPGMNGGELTGQLADGGMETPMNAFVIKDEPDSTLIAFDLS